MREVADVSRLAVLRLAFGALAAIGALSLSASPAAAQRVVSRKPVDNSAVKKPSAPKRAAPAALKEQSEPDANEQTPEFTITAEPLATSRALRPYLTGDEWQDTLLRFEQWLSVQTLYDAAQVEQMRTKFNKRAQAITTENRKSFIKEIDAKLDILYSRKTKDLEDHFAAMLAAASAAYAKKTRQQLPDVLGLTPEQLRERLARLAMRHQSTVEIQQTFDQMRQDKIAMNEARAEARAEARRDQARPSAGQLASASAGGGSTKNRYTQARDYFPAARSSITYSVIPAMPVFTSTGWAMFGGGVAITIQRNRP